jgi:hypothetical protein
VKTSAAITKKFSLRKVESLMRNTSREWCELNAIYFSRSIFFASLAEFIEPFFVCTPLFRGKFCCVSGIGRDFDAFFVEMAALMEGYEEVEVYGVV